LSTLRAKHRERKIMNLEQIINQLEFCKFTDEHGHPIELNVAFIALKNMVGKTLMPKYEKGDVLFYMNNNKPTKIKISSSQIFNTKTNQEHIQYTAEDFENHVTWLDHQYLREHQLFASKEELLASL